MSWAAHELEAYVIQKHIKQPVSFLAILVGSLGPDMLTKLPVYGITIGSFTLKAANPALYHRSWPGAGPTHSLMFGVVVALLVLALAKSRPWSLGLLLGLWAHAISDTLDSAGTMLFFPFTTQNYSLNMWAYAAGEGRYGDAAAYYSSLGGVWDLAWVGAVVLSIGVVSRKTFHERIVVEDPGPWGSLHRRFSLGPEVLLAVYRAYLVYGACRIFGWGVWARFINPNRGEQVVDLSWGGPFWVERVSIPAESTQQFIVSTVWGVAVTAAVFMVIWKVVGRGLWRRAGTPAPAAVGVS
jgi:membrane-bound metal-dependent hydrolase YbcI (DUF457 family)